MMSKQEYDDVQMKRMAKNFYECGWWKRNSKSERGLASEMVVVVKALVQRGNATPPAAK